MALTDTLTDTVKSILSTTFQERDGQKVPNSEDIALANGAVALDATFLYADLAGSSVIAQTCPWQTTAKIIRAYLDCAVRIIRAHDGEIRSFDGDRVMGVFIGGLKRTNAVKSALKIQWATENIIQPNATAMFQSISNNDVKIRQACGIDSGTSRAVRAGIRSNNDIIWIGRAPSFAAKLSDNREYPYTTFISKTVHDNMLEEARTTAGGANMWEVRSMKFGNNSETVYRSNYQWKP